MHNIKFEDTCSIHGKLEFPIHAELEFYEIENTTTTANNNNNWNPLL
jgi:hypothetical protein